MTKVKVVFSCPDCKTEGEAAIEVTNEIKPVELYCNNCRAQIKYFCIAEILGASRENGGDR